MASGKRHAPEIRGDAIVDAEAYRADRLHRARPREHAVDGVARVESAAVETRRPDEIDPGYHVGRHLAEIVPDDRRTAGESAAGELRVPRARLQERHIAGRGLHPHHDPVVEHVLIGQVGLAADAALDPLASPDRDPCANRKSCPIVRRRLGRAGAERRVIRRGGRQISGGGGRGREANRSHADAREGKTSDNDAHEPILYHRSACEALRFRLRHIDGGALIRLAVLRRLRRFDPDARALDKARHGRL